MTVIFARDEQRKLVELDPHEHHTIIVGSTRSGKSNTAYALLAGAAHDKRICVVGSDPSALLLAPFEDVGQPHIATGMADIAKHIAVLDDALAEMNRRIACLRERGVDQLTATDDEPTIIVVLEEFAGLLAECDIHDASQRGANRLKPRVLAQVGRLLREGAKAQVLVWTIIQRPDAELIGGSQRSQYARRITHRLDKPEAVAMLNEAVSPTLSDRVMTVPQGVALLNESGSVARLCRSFLVPYPIYREHVRSHYVPKPLSQTRKEPAL